MIVNAIDWWRENRDKAPDALEEDLFEALDLIVAQPNIGKTARSKRFPGVRRVLLSRVRYYLYYRFNQAADEIEVVGFWHTSRI